MNAIGPLIARGIQSLNTKREPIQWQTAHPGLAARLSRLPPRIKALHERDRGFPLLVPLVTCTPRTLRCPSALTPVATFAKWDLSPVGVGVGVRDHFREHTEPRNPLPPNTYGAPGGIRTPNRPGPFGGFGEVVSGRADRGIGVERTLPDDPESPCVGVRVGLRSGSANAGDETGVRPCSCVVQRPCSSSGASRRTPGLCGHCTRDRC